MKYRAEIDGLRALAVIPVILFHAGFKLFSGGFVGVDVFFVISGYLITTILIDDIENNRFSIVNFYERRARRILPALFFVMLCCLPFAWMWMLPNQMKDFSKSLIAVSLFVSNIQFWRESGYFDTAAEEKPLLHTWSLAVEEQYYVLFPIFLFLAWKFGKKSVFWMIVAFAAISLVLSEWGWRNYATANFYLAPTRVWELFAGSIAAFIVQSRGVRKNNILSLLGLSAVVFSIFVFDESTPFPSVYSIVPVFGVVLLVLFADKETIAAKLLSTKIFVGIGLISYSAYLWHQPLFAFARIRQIEPPSDVLMLGLTVSSLVLAYFSWLWVEHPFRQKSKVNRQNIFLFSLIGIVSFCAIGAYGIFKDGYLNKGFVYAPNIEYASMSEKILKVGDVCIPEFVQGLKWTKECEFGDTQADKTIVLIGDSHIQALSWSLDELFKKNNIKGISIELDGCEPIPYMRVDKNTSVSNCNERFDEFLKHVDSKESDVILLNRWSYRLYPIEGLIVEMPYKGSEGHVESDVKYFESDVLVNGEFFRDADTKGAFLKKYVEKIAEVSKSLFLVYSIPETGINVEKLNRFHYGSNNTVLDEISIPYGDYTKRNKFVAEVFERIENSNIVRIYPANLLCNTYIDGRCAVQIDGVPIYYDDDHLSKTGADILVEEIISNSNWTQPFTK
ncbi:acyltransferase [Sneathiella marina]|uniref:Acyltransferase n=1 Tax=Sneathiella marina TaxID=2950108 RepID=A0ABY4W2B8_9PROT|nr:acyltransferase family protein [Sneathiella marina]USG61311.1 acyltransferase [Sneathiella marina]